MVVETVVTAQDEEEDEQGDALGDEVEELSLVRRLQQQSRSLGRHQHHPSLDHDTEDEDVGGAAPSSSAAAAAAASADGTAAGCGGSHGGRGGGPSEALRAALRALKHEAPAAELVPLLVAARGELEVYLFRCPVPHKVC